MPGHAWADAAVAELAGLGNVRLMPRTTVFGAYDHGIHGALERMTDHLPDAGGKPRHVLWRVYARRTVLAAGATERPIAFGNNDRPGVMLAGAVRAYVNRWGAAPGRRVAVFTNNDDGWRTAHDLAAAGVELAAIIDSRDRTPEIVGASTAMHMGARVVDTHGRLGLRAVTLSNGRTVTADCLAVAGGWNPNLHLTCHQRGRPAWRDEIAAFVPAGELPPGMSVAGAANGALTLGAALSEGRRAAEAAVKDLGFTPRRPASPRAED
jgi:sarcosine oxidase subunit alpha